MFALQNPLACSSRNQKCSVRWPKQPHLRLFNLAPNRMLSEALGNRMTRAGQRRHESFQVRLYYKASCTLPPRPSPFIHSQLCLSMASLNTSTNGPSIKSSYQGVVNSAAPSGPAASSPTYGQWAVFSVSAPLVNAFQQDSGGKESVLKVQSTGGKPILLQTPPLVRLLTIYETFRGGAC